MQIDGEYYTVQTQGNLADIRSTPIFSSGGLDDGDHQFWGRDTSLPVNGLAYVDYFEYVVALTSFRSKYSILKSYHFQD